MINSIALRSELIKEAALMFGSQEILERYVNVDPPKTILKASRPISVHNYIDVNKLV
jgi:hypothetical protein